MIRGAALPRAAEWPPKPRELHAVELAYPPVEEHPAFMARIDPGQLVPAARHYNPSICRHRGRVFMAYRAEGYNAVSQIAIAELDSEFLVRRTAVVPLPCELGEIHWEDPHLCEAEGKLWLMGLYIRLQIPPICQPRLFEINPDTLRPKEELTLGFGNTGGIEKNWAPFELDKGSIGFVYKQRPRMVIDARTRAGFESDKSMPIPRGSSLSGRSGPVRIGANYLEFVGGWVRINTNRVGRYWFGAQMIRGEEPYDVIRATPEPLVWGSEASPTLFGNRPGCGHPCCVFPAGAIIEGDSVIVSVGVNDSYCTLMRFDLPALLAGMVPL